MKPIVPIVALACLALSSAGGAHDTPLRFGDTCDASAAVAVGDHRFLVGEDEHNVLRLYDLAHPEAAPRRFDLSAFLAIKPDKEADIEGAAWLGNRVFWITSHGRNKKGELNKNRLHRFFATEIVETADGLTVRPVSGHAYMDLVAALLADPQLQGLGLLEAAQPKVDQDPNLAPKEKGLNIEGLSAAADGKSLLIGFRNPIADKSAIVVPLLNPNEVVEHGTTPVFGAPILLELALGDERLRIRSIELVGKGDSAVFYIVGGPVAGKGSFALFRWSGDPKAKPTLVRPIADLIPEALFADPRTPGGLVLLSDDGEAPVASTAAQCAEDFADGKCPCKDLADPKLQSFRAVALQP